MTRLLRLHPYSSSALTGVQVLALLLLALFWSSGQALVLFIIIIIISLTTVDSYGVRRQ